jgi:hypothetical protein
MSAPTMGHSQPAWPRRVVVLVFSIIAAPVVFGLWVAMWDVLRQL